MRFHWVALVFAALLTGCASNVDTRATFQAEVTAWATEAAALATAGQAHGTQAAGTAAAAVTRALNVEGINQQLVSTLRVVVPPTRQVVNEANAPTPGMNEPRAGAYTPTPGAPAPTQAGGNTTTANTSANADATNQLTQIGAALNLNPVDDCAAGTLTTIDSSVSLIYATTRILNARQGTSINAAWSTGGQVVYTNNDPVIIGRDDTSYCVYLYVESSDVPFTPGEWQIQFSVNGNPAGSPTTFTMQ